MISPSPDPRGGLFIDFGDGRRPIHEDDLANGESLNLTDAERAALPRLDPHASDDDTVTLTVEEHADGR